MRNHIPALSLLSAEPLPPLLLGTCNSVTSSRYLPQYKVSPDFIYRTYKEDINEAGFIYEEFSVERIDLVSSLTHTIKMSQTFILPEST